eukprot:jgi/Botrbrau1/7039/Bobra.0165s0062.1
MSLLGSRISIAGRRACVCFVGQVDNQEGQWVGLDWDDLCRGKHDGTYDGKRYFACRDGRLAGTLMRLDKLLASTDAAISIAQALRSRYQESPQRLNSEQQDGMFVSTSSNRQVPVQLVVDGKEKPLESLSSAALGCMNICDTGHENELARLVPSLKELDLSDNLLSSWETVGHLASELPNLEVLNLSGNHLTVPSAPATAATSMFRLLQVLVLNHCGISFQQILTLERSIPALRELHLQGNGCVLLADPGTSLQRLEVLDLEGNLVNDWGEVVKLCWLPNLRQLQLSRNRLAAIQYPSIKGSEHMEGRHAFERLETLLLGDNLISTWDSVDELDKFPRLKDVRLTGNALLQSGPSGARFQVIARVAGLEVLNGSEVRPQERRDAELRYLRVVLGSLQEANAEEALAIQKASPRLPSLLKQYGDVGGATVGSQAGKALTSELREVRLTCLAAAARRNTGSQVKRLPGTMTLGNLKVLCERLFGLPVAHQVMYLRASTDPVPQPLGEDDLRDLSYLGVEDGNEILVDGDDPNVRKEAQDKELICQKAVQEQLMADQLRAVEKLMAVEKEQLSAHTQTAALHAL